MVSRIHNKLGTAGFVVAIVALVAALSGAAIAANNGLTGKQKKEVTKIAKKYAGKNGKNGAPGPAGAPGAKGPAGATGPAGTPGQDGEDGMCSEGNPTCKAPVGSTLTGNWSFSSPGGSVGYTSISLPLQAEPELEFTPGSKIVWVGTPIESEEERETNGGEPYDTTHCPGTPEEPEALPGYMCIYGKELFNLHDFAFKQPKFPWGSETVDLNSGVILSWELSNSSIIAFARGSWAYTQPEAE